MAASAKEKAYNLKDSYVAGLIEGGATAPAPAMPTQDMGEQASIVVDLQDRTQGMINDGNPQVIITDGHRTKFGSGNENAAYPLKGQGYNAEKTIRLSDDKAKGFARHLYGTSY